MQQNYNFADFGEGWGQTTLQEVGELNKALDAGFGYEGAPGDLAGGGALQVESLDASLKSVTYEKKNFRMWPIIAKDQAFNTVEQYNRIDAYGDQGRGFIAEGQLPRSEDSSYTRQVERVRFIGVTRELTHVYTLVRNAHGDAIAREIRNGTVRILEIVERNLFDGRGHYSNDGLFDGQASILDSDAGDIAWHGLDNQIRRGNTDASAQASAFTGFGLEEDVIIDQRGALLDQDTLEESARIVYENFGDANVMQLDTRAHSDLSKQFFPKERVNPMGVENGRAGFALMNFVAASGAFNLMSNVFLRPKRSASPVADAPSAPTLDSVTANAPSQANSKWTADDAGEYHYRATAISSAGESTLSASDSATVAADGSITVEIQATAGAFAYGIYRSPKGADANHEFIGYVAPAAIGGAATFTDLNHKLPGQAQAYLLSNDPEVIRFKQLAPLMKMDLAIVATAYRWMQLLYGTPLVYAPRKNVIIENIGRA